MYRSLDAETIVRRVDILRQRIIERFPRRNLAKVCDEMYTVATETHAQLEWLSRPIWKLRLPIWFMVAMAIYFLLRALLTLYRPDIISDLADFLTLVESGVNDVVLLGAAIFFLLTIENRVKRNRALDDLAELRALAHVIDMHQLTKDPSRLLHAHINTASSPQRDSLTPFELTRYLDYCSEMLSLLGKMAALYVQDRDDPVVLGAVNEIEALTNSLSNKIWQKIMIVRADVPTDQLLAVAEPADAVDVTEAWREERGERVMTETETEPEKEKEKETKAKAERG